jgi:hypothetical protein
VRQHTDHSCFPTALAITLGIPVPGVFTYLREVDRDYFFNAQEVSLAALKLGWAMIGLTRGIKNIPFDAFKDERGIVIVKNEEGENHAIAQLDADTFIDPAYGEQCSLDWESILHKFLLKKIL